MKRRTLSKSTTQGVKVKLTGVMGTALVIGVGLAVLGGCAKLERVPMVVLEPTYTLAQDPLVRFDPFDRGEDLAAVAAAPGQGLGIQSGSRWAGE
jgi:hypothetical protein